MAKRKRPVRTALWILVAVGAAFLAGKYWDTLAPLFSRSAEAKLIGRWQVLKAGAIDLSEIDSQVDFVDTKMVLDFRKDGRVVADLSVASVLGNLSRLAGDNHYKVVEDQLLVFDPATQTIKFHAGMVFEEEVLFLIEARGGQLLLGRIESTDPTR